MTSSQPPSGPAPRLGDPRPAGERPIASLRATVDEAVAALDDLPEHPVSEHVAAFERVHTALGEALSAGSDRA